MKSYIYSPNDMCAGYLINRVFSGYDRIYIQVSRLDLNSNLIIKSELFYLWSKIKTKCSKL